MSFGIVLGVVILDQWTKHIAVTHLDRFSPKRIIDSFFNLILVSNKGAAFGFLSGANDTFRTIFFAGVSLSACGLLIYLYRHRPAGSYIVPVAVSLIFGGAIGNWIDRVRFGYVIDFLDFYINGYHWPTFNMADSCITTGVGLLLLQMILEEKK